MSKLLLEINGSQYSNFTSANVDLQLDAIAGSFNFESVATRKQLLPIKVGDLCSIYADGEKVLTGYVENVSIDYDSSSHSIAISGRSKTADIIDSMINNLEIKPPITFKSIIEKIVSHIGSDIKVVDGVGNIEKFNSAEDLISPEVGGNAFEFIEKIARKRQVLLTCNGEGDILITKAGNENAPVGLQNVLGKDDNNIESASVSYDHTARFRKYISKSQSNLVALGNSGSSNSKDIVNQKSTGVEDKEIRSSRQLVIQAESASSDKQNELRVQWEANIRKARSAVYSANVLGFGKNGNLWKVNQLAKIKDEFADIDAQMLINGVSFSQDSYSSSTVLSFVERDSYTLKINEPESGNKLGAGIV